jgi:type I restriction enzyme S subunit
VTELPNSWHIARLGESLELLLDHRGKTPGKLGGEFVDSGVPAISAIHIKEGAIDWSQRERFVTDEMYRRWMPQPLRAGDVLMTSEAPLGSLAIVPTDEPLVLSQRLFALRGRAGYLDNKYLRWFLESPQARQQLDARSSGSTVTGIRQTELRQIEVPIGPLDEQRRIISLLESHLSRLDAAEENLRLASKRSKALVKSILVSLIPGESDYPDSWRRATVAEAGAIELGRQRHPDWHHGPNMKPYLRVANVFEDRIDTSDVMQMHWPDATFERFRLRLGDVLLNEGQTPDLLGRPALYRGDPPEAAFTNSLLRFKANDGVLPEFALLVFRRHMHAGRFKRESRITTNIAHLSAGRLKPIEFPIPPMDDQKRIVTAAAKRLDAVKVLQRELLAAQRHSAALRRSLLAAAFSGRLTRAEAPPVEEMVSA